jgi:hypothetical protein
MLIYAKAFEVPGGGKKSALAWDEQEAFEACRQKWNAAAAVIVPQVRQAQTAGGIESYAPEQYEVTAQGPPNICRVRHCSGGLQAATVASP